MIVNVVHVIYVGAIESEDDAPVTAYVNGMKAGESALERMKPQTRQGHIAGTYRHVKLREDQAQAVRMLGPNSRLGSGLKELGKPFVPAGANHRSRQL